ncbi:MAG: hypothetical protein KAU28_07675 [Phycisphaerae bacterium]|nr:hypothetical protein [Phycisphaerae bacterium]
MTMFSTLNLRKGENHRMGMNARMAAESGLAFMLDVMNSLRLPGTTTGETFCANLQGALAEKLEGTANLAGAQVIHAGEEVFVPDIEVEGKTFCCWVTLLSEDRCQMKIRGSSDGVTRYLTMDFTLAVRAPAVFDYGLASRGPITIFGNARIVGVNYLTEANVISTTDSHLDALNVDGNAEVSGDLFTAGDGTYVTVSGNPKIAGTQDPVEIAQHIHQGVEVPDFPEIDVAPIAALATYTLQPDDPTNKGTFNNLIIPAGANPNFTNDVVLNGVVYIEAPNVVKFEGKCTLNGLVVTQESSEPISTCRLRFAGHVEANGVGALPDTPEFALVKQQTGTFILAPGFGVTFEGNFSAISGSIAADQLTFTGTAEGTIQGSVIGLEDLLTSVGGNVDIFVDRNSADPDPAGFIKSFGFEPTPDSYTELKGG